MPKMTDAQKKNMQEGRQFAKQARAAANELFEKYGDFIGTAKFWKGVDLGLRRDIAAALKRAEKVDLKKEINDLEKQLEAKKEEYNK